MEEFNFEAPDIGQLPVLNVADLLEMWPQVLSTIIVVVVAMAVTWGVRWLFKPDNPWFDQDEDGYRSSAAVKGTLLGPLIVWICTWLIVVSMVWEANMSVVLASLSFVFLGVGFALRSIIGNFFAGLISLFDGAYTEGSLIQLSDGTIGFVRKVGWFSTDIQTHSKVVSVPNDNLKSEAIVNFDLKSGFRGEEVLIGIDDIRWGDNSLPENRRVNAENVGAIIDRVLGTGEFDLTHDRFGNSVEAIERADWSWHEIHGDAVVLAIRVWCATPLAYFRARGRCLKLVMEAFDQAGISYGYTTFLATKAWKSFKATEDPFLF